ncbi:MAG: Hsp20/alpha crystallin family protein [Candidatus Krumholzibacteriota bacterium]|nr:Hsp20/alpha crystallin family protein [Candidatus Krumholzibacteriota bacterium]
MKLVRWMPTSNLNRFEDEVNDIFSSFFPARLDYAQGGGRNWVPRVNVRELDEKFELSAEIPGMEKDELSIEVQENTLTIRGEKKTEEKIENEKMHIKEIFRGKFERSFKLPENIKADDVDAEYKNGMLIVSIPKTEPAKPKEINVKIK